MRRLALLSLLLLGLPVACSGPPEKEPPVEPQEHVHENRAREMLDDLADLGYLDRRGQRALQGFEKGFLPFTPEAWATASPQERYRQVPDLLERNDLTGRTAAEIEELLGPLRWGRELEGGRYRYSLLVSPEGASHAESELIVELDASGIVSDVWLSPPEQMERIRKAYARLLALRADGQVPPQD